MSDVLSAKFLQIDVLVPIAKSEHNCTRSDESFDYVAAGLLLDGDA
jgi:hypothetical protein